MLSVHEQSCFANKQRGVIAILCLMSRDGPLLALPCRTSAHGGDFLCPGMCCSLYCRAIISAEPIAEGESPHQLLRADSLPPQLGILWVAIMHRVHTSLLLLCLYRSALPELTAGCVSPPETRCNFVCDCWDCSDESQCGYRRDSPVLGALFSCDFEQDDCGWKDISTSSYKWVRDRRSFSVWGSRPPADHTLGTKWGWFMATEGHRGKSSVTASLRSPVLRDAAATCEIHVHYHMWAPDSPTMNGSLSVQLTDKTQTYRLWLSPQSSVLAWRQIVIYTGRIKGEFQLIVSSSQDPSSRGDIAIDDLEFRHCAVSAPQAECNAEQYQCARGSCVGKDGLCDGNDDCGDDSDESDCKSFQFCTFEQDLCGWNATRFSWQRVNGSQPSRDHTSNSRSGHFLRAGSGSPDPATLTSPQLQAASNESCALVLYYHMDGSDTSQLEIYYLISMEKKKVGGRWGQRGHVWLRDRVIFQLPDETFQIVIEGTVGNGADHFIALDDLILSPGCKVVEGRTLERSKAEIWSSPIGQHQFSSGVNEICNITEGKFDFESGEGRWKDRSVGRLRWGTENRTLQEGEARGYYLAVLHAGGQFLTSAEVHSPTFCPSGPSCAINMFYYFNSGPAGSLSVRVLDPELGTHTHVWHSQGEQSTSWRSAVITLGERQRPFQVVLAGSVDPLPGGRWGAAVDDIEFVGCGKVDTPSDTAPVTCNFETGLCGWYQDKSEEIDWELGTLSDHTTGSGNFLYVDGGSRMDRGMRARLLTYPQSSGSGTQCLSLYYRMWGPDAGTLNLFVKYDGEEDKLLWTSTGTHGNKWHQESVTLPHPPNRQYQLVLDAVRDGSVGHIAVDDITLRSASCAAPTRCSFEAGSCGFSSQGTYTWKLHQNLPVDDRIGPPYDHTLQSITGHYMLVDTSAAALPSKKSAILTSGEYNLVPSEGCLSFWYQLGGSKAGTLNVHLEEQPGKKKKRRLLSVSETHGDSWHYKSATLQSERGWTVSFEAVGAGGDRSYIALDDLHISHHPCHKAASCDFESGSCTWTNVRIPLVDTYDWDWTSGEARSRKSSAPEKDHSLGTPEGHYAFVDTGALHTDGSSAWLISEHLPATTGSCFTFWYRTDSAEHHHLGELMLFVTSAQGMLPVWGLHGYHNNDWQEEQIQLNSTVEFQIVFEASKGSRPHAATVALDDVHYTLDTPCNTKKEKAKDNTRTTVIVILVVILILLVAIVAVLLYRRRKRRQEGAPQMSSHVDGFDNIIFQENEDTLSTD